MMSLTFGLFTQVSGSGPLGPLVIGLLILINLFFNVLICLISLLPKDPFSKLIFQASLASVCLLFRQEKNKMLKWTFLPYFYFFFFVGIQNTLDKTPK